MVRRKPFGNKSEIAATTVISVAAKKKTLNAVMPKGLETREGSFELMIVNC